MRALGLSRQRGDTIIEVMIVLTILGLAIGISYSTANRSLLNARQAQENSEATKLAESQIESMQSFAKDTSTAPNSTIYNQTNPFCINVNSLVQLTGADNTNYSNYPSGCQVGTDAPYYISITHANDGTDTFTVKVLWDDIRGDGRDSVTLVYRIHAPS